MALAPGTHSLGPDNATLWIRTKRTGAAAKAGHDLLIEVTAWSATIEAGEQSEQTRMELTADSRSLKVLEGTGGLTSLGDDDKAGIAETINKDVLKGCVIAFQSTSVQGEDQLTVQGELELGGHRALVTFELSTAAGRLTGAAVVKQTAHGIKPYSALFGTLKVADDVTVEIDARLPHDPG